MTKEKQQFNSTKCFLSFILTGEAKEFLKMRIRRVGKKLILDQQDYLKKIVTWFSLDDAKSA